MSTRGQRRRQAATDQRHRSGITPASLEDRYRLLFDRNLAGVYRTTLKGAILDCNESFARMLGYRSRKEVLTRHAGEFYHTSSDRQAFLARLRRKRVLTNSELCLRRKDGTPIYILENVSLVPDECGVRRIIQGTMVDITERKQAEEALRASEDRYRTLAADLRRLTQHLQMVREEERRRIARELHDDLGQSLTALQMDLYWLARHIPNPPAAIQTRITPMCQTVDATIKSVRRICADLRPALLDDLGLLEAIEWQVREFQTRTGVRCRQRLSPLPRTVSAEQATSVFRILQEGLTNIARHARATRARVELRTRQNMLFLVIADNGVGITPAQAAGSRSLGMIGMRERAWRWGGTLEVASQAGKGTVIELRMPLRNAEKRRTS